MTGDGVNLQEFDLSDGPPNADDPALVRALKLVIDVLDDRRPDDGQLAELSAWLGRVALGDVQVDPDTDAVHLLLYLRGVMAYNHIADGKRYKRGVRRQITNDGGEYPFHQIVVFAPVPNRAD